MSSVRSLNIHWQGKKLDIANTESAINHTSRETKAATRMLFIDNLRLVFTVFVILHHVSLTYGAHSGWYYYETLHDPFTNLVLNILMTLNRAWIIVCFFMISGYFTPGSLDRKGSLKFIIDRFIRLGIPILFFSLIIRPTLIYTVNYSTLARQYTYLENIFLLKNTGPGPTWFLETLLVFSIVYALWRYVFKKNDAGGNIERPFPSNSSILLFIIVVAAFTFVIRIYFPTEKQVFHLRLGNYVEYIAFFVVGIMAYRYQWFSQLTEQKGRQWTLITMAAICVYTLMIVAAWSLNTSLSFFRGGLSLKTLVATYVETFIAVGSSITLVYIFRNFFNAQPNIVKNMSKDAYAVFIFHAPILVALCYLVRNMLTEYPFLKFVSVFIVGTILCFVICRYVVRKIPYAQKVL